MLNFIGANNDSYSGSHPLLVKWAKKPTKNDVRRNKRMARKWKMVSARFWSGYNTSDFSGPHFEGSEFVFKNKAGALKWFTEETISNGNKITKKAF